MLVLACKRSLAALGLVLLLAGAASGLAEAQTATPPASQQATPHPSRQQFLDALAKRLGIATTQLEQAVAGARSDVGLPSGGAAHHGWHGARRWAMVAQVIGITPQQLRQELPGKSLAEVAQAHGKSPAEVATALKNAAHGRLDQQVTNGQLAADQASQRKQVVDQRIDQAMVRVVPAGGVAPAVAATPAA